MSTIKIKRLHPGAIIPKHATAGAACFDLHAVCECPVSIVSDCPATIRTGLAFEIPPGFVMLVFSRSGHGFKHDVRLANCVGVIDSDYRGEVYVRLSRDFTLKTPTLTVNNGDRIAQAMLLPVPAVALVEVDELGETERGEGGFGSTGE